MEQVRSDVLVKASLLKSLSCALRVMDKQARAKTKLMTDLFMINPLISYF